MLRRWRGIQFRNGMVAAQETLLIFHPVLIRRFRKAVILPGE